MKHRIYRVVFFLAVAALACLSPGCRSTQALPGQWLAVAASADGRLDDFSKKITSHLFENGMLVGVGNDDRDLVVFFSPDIRHRQPLPGRATLTLWLDEGGGRARKLGLVIVSGQLPMRPPRAEAAPEMQRAEPLEAAGSPQVLLKIIERRSGRETFITADGSQGPAVRLASDWGDFSYQLRVPILAAAGSDWPGLRLQPGKPIGIGIIWKMELQAGSARKGSPGGPPGQGDEGAEMGPPLARMEGRGPGKGMPWQNAPRRRTLWLKTFLVNK
jgi:hypothetical protein